MDGGARSRLKFSISATVFKSIAEQPGQPNGAKEQRLLSMVLVGIQLLVVLELHEARAISKGVGGASPTISHKSVGKYSRIV